MDSKLKQLTEKLYNEGVVKGSEEAEKIVDEAKKKADSIVDEATKKAKLIVEEAGKKANELEKNTLVELQMASKQVQDSLRQDIANLISGEILTESIRPAMSDPAFIKELILQIAKNWANGENVAITIPKEIEEKLIAELNANTKQKLNNEIKIIPSDKINNGFIAGPEDGSYKLSFTDEDFINYFQSFIRPKIVELLFKEK